MPKRSASLAKIDLSPGARAALKAWQARERGRETEIWKASREKAPTASGPHGNWLLGAARSGKAKDVLECLRAGADPLAKNQSGQSALMITALLGHLECVRTLLPVSAPKARDHSGETALMFAVQSKHVAVVQALVPVSDLGAQNKSGLTALHQAIELGARMQSSDSMTIFMALLAGSDPETLNDDGESPLSRAVEIEGKKGDMGFPMTRLLLARCDPRASNPKTGSTALMHAAETGVEALVGLLLPVSDALAKDARGRRASGWAKAAGHESLRRMLRAAEEAIELGRQVDAARERTRGSEPEPKAVARVRL